MKTIILFCIVNAVYFLMWILIYKLRNSTSNTIRTLDNGYTFYGTLSADNKNNYWTEDTKNLNIFFFTFLIFLEVVVYFISIDMSVKWWISTLLIGLLCSTLIAIILNINLKRKYKKLKDK